MIWWTSFFYDWLQIKREENIPNRPLPIPPRKKEPNTILFLFFSHKYKYEKQANTTVKKYPDDIL